MSKKPYYITTAIAYTSGKPHIGNVYEIILADSIARYHRLKGEDVFFQTGTDEHGQKIEDKAKAAGKPTQQYVDEIAAIIKDQFDYVNVSYDKFVRTTDHYHKSQVQKMFRKLYDQGDIYKGEYEGMYCKPCESFFTSSQLVDGKCPDCGGEVQPAKEEAYFFRMSKYQDRLIQHIYDNPRFIQPESRKNEMLNNFLLPGLQDLCVSRTSFKWGVPVDFDDRHVVYVWIDALSNYITGLGFDVEGDHGELYKKYWPADVHLIGKDILRFHTIYWPIMLMALNIELPKQVFGHPWLMMGDGKMSKSKGNVTYADDLVDKFTVDGVRYFCLHEMPFANDGVLTPELMIERINSDLANILGNLVNRTISMANKYFDGKVSTTEVYDDLDYELFSLATETINKVDNAMESLKVAEAIDAVIDLLSRLNKYIDETQPWKLAKDSASFTRLETVIFNLLEGIRVSAVLLSPFIPTTSVRIFDQLQTTMTSYDSILLFGKSVKTFQVVSQPTILFARIDVDEFMAKYYVAPTAKVVEHKPLITFDEFSKLELRIGSIIECSKHPQADKLLVSKVDIGDKTVQIVSGIAKDYQPDSLVGKKVVVVVNLAPVKLRGILSEGMLLAGEGEDKLELLTVEQLAVGSYVK
jgi:methionyl-tRNA synthetase